MPRPHHIVVGISWGDEGKGTITDSLTRKLGASVVVRFNGGGQAAHNVVTNDGRHHTFSQWGSGTLAGAHTILTKDVAIDPLAMAEEANALIRVGVATPFSLLAVDGRALVTTPYHAEINRLRERLRGEQRHGSCGTGFGETIADSIAHPDDCLRAADLSKYDTLAWKLQSLRLAKGAEASRLRKGEPHDSFFLSLDVERRILERLYDVGQRVHVAGWDEIATRLRTAPAVFEGAQGVLLDEWHGFHPHTTWSTTTADNARATIVAAEAGEWVTVGVTRAYATRHGAGPFPTEIDGAGPPVGEHNAKHDWQGRFRVGCFDAVLARYAVEAVSGVDALAVTCCDHMGLPACVGYAFHGGAGNVSRFKVSRDRDLDRQQKLGEFLGTVKPDLSGRGVWSAHDIARQLGVPLMVSSHGPRAADKRWRP